jgi:hypothetical protein
MIFEGKLVDLDMEAFKMWMYKARKQCGEEEEEVEEKHFFCTI